MARLTVTEKEKMEVRVNSRANALARNADRQIDDLKKAARPAALAKIMHQKGVGQHWDAIQAAQPQLEAIDKKIEDLEREKKAIREQLFNDHLDPIQNTLDSWRSNYYQGALERVEKKVSDDVNAEVRQDIANEPVVKAREAATEAVLSFNDTLWMSGVAADVKAAFDAVMQALEKLQNI